MTNTTNNTAGIDTANAETSPDNAASRPPASQLAGVVLAAGMSSRMGRFKPLLEVDGKSMIRHVVDCMRAVGADPIVVVTGHNADLIREHLSDTGVTFVHNPDYAHTQQLESLRCALSVLEGKAQRIIMSPADVPLYSQDTAFRLLDLPGDFVRPVCDGKVGHPVIFTTVMIPMLMQYAGEGGLRGAVESSSFSITEMRVKDRGTVMDNDTPEDFQRLTEYAKTIR